jgi:hypothetical protein
VIDIGAYEFLDYDQTPPVTVASATPPPGGSGWNTTDVTVTLNATDDPGGSGVANIRYSLTGAQQSGVIAAGNPASITVTAEGITTVNFSAVDKAGNVGPSGSLDVAIDRTGPVIAGLPKQNKCGLIPSKHQMVQVAVVTASDSLSGVSSLVVTASSNEPDSGTGPDDLPGDIVISGNTVQLRAERSPSGPGRVYTIVSTAQDSAGNTTTMTTTCTVPN